METHWRDRDELIELIGRYTDGADLPDWELPKTVFADEVAWDFSSIGLPAKVFRRDALIDLLRKGFAGWQATHHIASGHQIRVDGDYATIHAKVRAEYWLPAEVAGDGPNRWLIVGFYDDEAIRTESGWRLSKVRLTVTYQEHSELLRLAYRSDA